MNVACGREENVAAAGSRSRGESLTRGDLSTPLRYAQDDKYKLWVTHNVKMSFRVKPKAESRNLLPRTLFEEYTSTDYHITHDIFRRKKQ